MTLWAEAMDRLDEPPECAAIDFPRLAELFVKGAALQALADREPDSEPGGGGGDGPYLAIEASLLESRDQRVPFDDRPIAECAAVLLGQFRERLAPEWLEPLGEGFALRLGRVEAREGIPIRLAPFSRGPTEDAPQVVVVDPRVRFGRPTIAGHGLPTDILFGHTGGGQRRRARRGLRADDGRD